MKGGSVVAMMVATAAIMMSVGEANDLWPDCPALCEQICGGAIGRTPDTFCTATCQAILCALWPPPSPPPPPPPAEPPVPDNKECPALCEKVCGITHDPGCIALCVALLCPRRAAAPPTALP